MPIGFGFAGHENPGNRFKSRCPQSIVQRPVVSHSRFPTGALSAGMENGPSGGSLYRPQNRSAATWRGTNHPRSRPPTLAARSIPLWRMLSPCCPLSRPQGQNPSQQALPASFTTGSESLGASLLCPPVLSMRAHRVQMGRVGRMGRICFLHSRRDGPVNHRGTEGREGFSAFAWGWSEWDGWDRFVFPVRGKGGSP